MPMSENDAGTAPGAPHAPSLAALFVAFLTASLSGFGGVLPWARRMIVEQRRWMTAEEFNDAFALCNFLPGPNIVNFSVIFGSRFRGAAGAAVALIGLLGPPVTIVLVLGALYAEFGSVAYVRGFLAGVAPAAVGVMIATTLKMAQPILRRQAGPAPVIVLAAIVAIGVMRWPLVPVLLVLVPLSIALAWWWHR
jgi:chromate transporter